VDHLLDKRVQVVPMEFMLAADFTEAAAEAHLEMLKELAATVLYALSGDKTARFQALTRGIYK
jgi:hypothetical protein